MADHTARYLATADSVQLVPDVVFGQVTHADGQAETLRLDLYLPEGETHSPRPAILWFHGGGFRPGNDKRQVYIPRFAQAFAARGYVGIAPDYRVRADPTPDMAGAVRDAVADARLALDWVRAHSREYGIDPTRLVLAGGSAGGMTVLNLCHAASRPVDRKRDGVFAILDMWGSPDGPCRLFERVNPDSPPTLLIHGTADALVPYQCSQDLSAELTQAGVDNVLLTLPDAPHTPLMHLDRIVATMERFLHDRMEHQE